jgi:chemotaxis protein methyltransferase CheR
MAVHETVVTAADFAFVAKLLHEQCGVILEPGKEYLIKSRLAPLVQKHGLASIDDLLQSLRAAGNNRLLAEVVEAMVTTETSFFRDVHPFDTLRETVLPQLIERRHCQRQLNIWCAASSSGQEPYSIAILLREHFPELDSWRVHISATDMSHEMLRRSRAGRYSQVEVNRGLPTRLLPKWFRQDGTFWHIADSIRDSVVFTHINLARPWPTMPMWDLILLRNVMIYLYDDVKKSILNRVAHVLCQDGYLLLGGVETTFGLSDSFSHMEELKSGFYQLR